MTENKTVTVTLEADTQKLVEQFEYTRLLVDMLSNELDGLEHATFGISTKMLKENTEMRNYAKAGPAGRKQVLLRNADPDPVRTNCPTAVVMPTGVLIDLLNPHPKQIHKDDIILCLQRQVRWAGTLPVSIAAHSMLCAYIAEDYNYMRTRNDVYVPVDEEDRADIAKAVRTHMLLHDAHEAYVGDFLRPVLKAADHNFQEVMKNRYLNGVNYPPAAAINGVAKEIDGAIYERFGVKFPDWDEQEWIKQIDSIACDIERQLTVNPPNLNAATKPHAAWIDLMRDEHERWTENFASEIDGLWEAADD